MQRIDESTYIDDTLVTCAEYQLFIDEMREQGKYYQPDHWNLIQFPVGQALGPITGVRFNDVKEFCKWLTERESGEWKFRLPMPREIELSPNIQTEQLPLGYWCNGDFENDHKFIWVGAIPSNPRGFVYDIRQHFGFDHKIDTTIPLDIDHHIAFGITGTSTVEFARIYVQDHTGARDRALGVARRRTRDLIIADTTEMNRKRYGLNLKNIHAHLMFLVDIITLQERIAGRSPSFEGIRLVKERIR